jgi:hypothetical protein
LDGPVDELERLARLDRIASHSLSEIDDADVILFPQCHMLGDDWRLDRIAPHPAAAGHPGRVVVYDERDRPWCRFPGVYVSMPRQSFQPRFQRAWSYFPSKAPPLESEPDLLYSFVGSPTHRSRGALIDLKHPDGLVEMVYGFTFFDPRSRDYEARRARYREVLGRSRFVLCPRGAGTSSIRLYETIAAGRVPVIIADDWVVPAGPAWESFSLRWPEDKVAGLPEFLVEHDQRWPEMSLAAREAHRSYFADDVWFDAVASLCEQAQRDAAFPRRGVRNRAFFSAWRHHLTRRAKREITRRFPAVRSAVRAVRRSGP